MNTRSLGFRLFTLLLVAGLLPALFPLPVGRAGPAAAAPLFSPSTCPTAALQGERALYPSLALVLEAEPFYAYPGEAATLTLALRNDGGLPLEGVVVSATLPAGLAGVQPSAGDYDRATGRLTLPLPRLEVDQALSVTVTAHVTGRAMQEGHAIAWAEAGGGRCPTRGAMGP